MTLRAVATFGLALTAGCTLAQIPNGGVICSSGSCPSGFSCQGDGHCWLSGTGPDAGPAGQGDAGPDGGPADAGPGDAGVDAGSDAGLNGGFDAGLDGGPLDAGFCVIAGNNSDLPDLPDPRSGLGAAYLSYVPVAGQHFEQIFTVGGFDPSGITTADVELDEFEVGNSWSPVGNTNLTPRALFALVSQADVGVIAIGGEDLTTGTVLGDMVIFQVGTPPVLTSSWTEQTPSLIQARANHAAVVEKDLRTLITCGGRAGGSPTNTCEVISLDDLDAGWQAGPAMLSQRQGLSMVLGPDGNVYALSGSGGPNTSSLASWERLDTTLPDAGWSCPGTCPSMHSGHVNGAAAVVGTDIFILGGTPTAAIPTSLAAAEYLDVTNLLAGWQEIQGIPTARSYFAAVALPTNSIRVIGGLGGPDNSCTVGSVEEYTPSTGSWR